MKQVLIQQGRAVVEEVPGPLVEEGAVLVQVVRSCISAGTEMSGVRASAQPLWKRALTQPSKLKKALHIARTEGLGRLQDIIQNKLAAGAATGYSATGIVLETGAGVTDLAPGDRVACAGARYAHHAEVICVPRNLVVPLPAGLDFDDAATVTLGAIALQGIRRAQPTLGETFVVLGLGILGQLTVQLLRADGCRVVGVDLDRTRIRLALDLGMEVGLHTEDGDDVEQVVRLTDGIGADGAIITAATPDHALVSTAFRMCRKKGRVVLVGDVGLNLNRADIYDKELDFFISTSYGPGRYDRRYEEEGLDYPVGYVRWTENRNMAEYLRLVASRQVRTRPLVSSTYAVEQAAQAYESLQSSIPRPLIVLLSYAGSASQNRIVVNPRARTSAGKRVRLAVIGAGGFARGVHLPNLRALAALYELRAVVSRTGHNALAAARQFGAAYSTTDYRQVLSDPEVDAVLITTRHHVHASMTLEALQAGKHVLVEKPLALTEADLAAVSSFFDSSTSDRTPLLLTGFNRRFSPFIREIDSRLQARAGPMILGYRMNAGYLPPDHWVHGLEGGGRNRGEACHIYDLFTHFTQRPVTSISVQAAAPRGGYYTSRDNFVATMAFADGSVATLTYTALGTTEYPKEHLEIYCDGQVIVLTDYQRLEIHGSKKVSRTSRSVEKGQKEELEAFARAILTDGDWPIPLWQQQQATAIACAVETKLDRMGGPATRQAA